MRFLRQLAAVSLAVALIVALGVAWSRAGGTSLAGRPGPHAAQQVTARQIAARQAAVRRTDGFSLGNPKSLERTVMVEAVLTGIVVAASRTRRRRRQARRRTLSSASP